MTSSRRRDFLRAVVSALTRIGLPPALGSSAWGDASVTRPFGESLVTQSDVDGLRLGRASAKEYPGATVLVPLSGGSEESITAGGIVLDLFRYDSDGQSVTVYQRVLPRQDIAAGLYLRSAVILPDPGSPTSQDGRADYENHPRSPVKGDRHSGGCPDRGHGRLVALTMPAIEPEPTENWVLGPCPIAGEAGASTEPAPQGYGSGLTASRPR
jgi:hypothetical protein